MATQYCDWTNDVLGVYPQAASIESVGANQTTLIETASAEFQSYIRSVHKDWLVVRPDDSKYDPVVRKAVASMVADVLRKRRKTDNSELETGEFEHIVGLFTSQGLEAHGIIQAIRKRKIILEQDHSEKDADEPEVVWVTKTGTGSVHVILPQIYDSHTVDTFRAKFTTAGRVDAADARYTIWRNYNDADKLTDQTPGAGKAHIYGGVYLSFLDEAETGNSFALNDEFTLQMVPPQTSVKSGGARNINFFAG